MMEQFALDPYEQQLLKVFDSHDRDNCGSLDRDGLIQLCQTLQLEEQGSDLIKCLLNENKNARATFIEFKDALLTLLGSMQNDKTVITEEQSIKEIEKTSPDREVSPKFVYGSKKYGRRSRPRNEEAPNCIFEQNDLNEINKSPTVQRSNSQTEVSNSKKRKTNYKLKRCTSLPGNKDSSFNEDNSFITSSLTSEPEMVCTEDMLREAWKKLGVGKDGYLNQNELILVFDEIGLHKLADGVIRQLSDKLTLNYDHKISFQELLEALQQDETWFDLLNNTGTPRNNLPDFPDSRTFHYITLGPDGNGFINTDVLIEMWETVGIHSPKELIHELGFNSRRINIVELADILEKQIKGINEITRSEFQNPHITLLQANLTLYQSEIRCFKNVLEQMHAEREKLKGDVIEANNRATLLAQEVDDNHLRMEQNTINQVKLLEQRHADILKDVATQYSKDKEQLSVINQSLEDRINVLESEAVKLKNDLQTAQKYSINIEKENVILTGKITELERDKNLLTEQITVLEAEKQSHNEKEFEENEMLLTKLSALQIENSQLKDRNDEMVSEIESLSLQMAGMRTKMSSTPTALHTLDQSMEENISIICEGVAFGGKRRSEFSPTKENNLFGLVDGSPRLGKVRKFNKIKGENLEVPFTSNESGFDTEVDCLDSLSTSTTTESEEILRLQSKVAFLEQILRQNSLPLPVNEQDRSQSGSNSIVQLSNRVNELENIISIVKSELRTMIDKDCVHCDKLKVIREKLEHTIVNEKASTTNLVDVSLQTEENFEDKIKEMEASNAELTAKCSELENCVELLRNEYEKCEDYWQTKVDEERQMFDVEQRLNSEKLNELLIKMKEYEDQYINNQDNRLPTIEETYNLEKQFTDLEQEFEDFKCQTEMELFNKDEEITVLKEKLTELAVRRREMAEVSTQVDDQTDETLLINKMKNFSSYVIENTSRFADDMLPPPGSDLIWNQKKQTDSTANSTSSLPLTWSFSNNTEIPSTSSSSTCLEKTPCRPKRTRKHDKNLYKKNNSEKDVKKTDVNTFQANVSDWKTFKDNMKQTVSMPVSTLQNLTKRRNFLEQRVRQLQHCIRQQQFDKEQTLQYYWQHFIVEKADLQNKLRVFQEKLDQQKRLYNEQLDKLERTDILVKDLFVENAYLIARVQMLENKCHMLAHCSNSSSV